jgi:hypothetical protein
MHMPRRVIAFPRNKDVAAAAELPHLSLLLPHMVTPFNTLRAQTFPEVPHNVSAQRPCGPLKQTLGAKKVVKPRRATAFGAARHWHFAGGASTPPLTKGMLRAPLEPQHKVPHPKGGA